MQTRTTIGQGHARRPAGGLKDKDAGEHPERYVHRQGVGHAVHERFEVEERVSKRYEDQNGKDDIYGKGALFQVRGKAGSKGK